MDPEDTKGDIPCNEETKVYIVQLYVLNDKSILRQQLKLCLCV